MLFLRRLVALIPTLLVVSIVTFALLQLVPGSPGAIILGNDATNAQIAALNNQLGLNKPVLLQYFSWVGQVLHGNLGDSVYSGQSVLSEVMNAAPVTLSLVVASTILAVIVGVAVGAYAGLRPGSRGDQAVLVGTSVGFAIPGFWLALLLVVPLAVWVRVFPATGFVSLFQNPFGWLRSIALGTVALSVVPASAIARQTRAALVRVMSQDFIRAARARGVTKRRTVLKHGLKNGAIPVVTILGHHVNALIGGALIVEQIFGLNGIGSLAIGSVENHDIPIVQGVVLITALIVVAVNLGVDLTYGWLNPKVRAA